MSTAMLEKYLLPEILSVATDIRFQTGDKIWACVNKRWIQCNQFHEVMDTQDLIDMISEFAVVNEEKDLIDTLSKDKKVPNRDFCMTVSLDDSRPDEKYRIRGHVSTNYSGTRLDVRVLNNQIPSLEKLGFKNNIIDHAIHKSSGLVIIGGPTGSGKSTTLAACVKRFAEQKPGSNIVTLEDPVEYELNFKNTIISQKAIGINVPSWEEGIFSAKREIPNLIVIGELRDRQSILAAIDAAGSGHLVFATTFADRVPRVLDTIADSFGAGQKELVQRKLSYLTRAIFCQLLVPGVTRQQLCYEVMANDNDRVKSHIMDGKWSALELRDITNSETVTWDSRIAALERERLIEDDVAEMLKCR